uniref:Uncharacterized protein n=1 Tax=Mycena chlorophos TaxID=658473 RepID=A0ABQ0LA84_MYCCL|nr:predicted protein [Mycena chlorophos]
MHVPYLHVFLFYGLNLVANAAQTTLKATNSRFREHGEERRRSITSIFSIIVAKTLLFVVAFPVVCAVVFGKDWSAELVIRSQLCGKILLVVYTFDLTYRRANTILWIHHTLTFIATLSLLMSTVAVPEAPDIARLWCSVPLTFIGIGVGATDIGGDVAVLLYYLCPQKSSTARAIRSCAWYLVLGRATAWSIVVTFFMRGDWRALELGWMHKAIVPVMLVGWISAEIEEIFAILGMSEKMRLEASKVIDVKY